MMVDTNHSSVVKRKACLFVVTAVVVWHILFFPATPFEKSASPSASSQWTSGPLDFSSSGHIRGAAMMLVSKPWTSRRGERQCFFNKSMDALSVNWHPNNPYPIILQHPNGWTEQEMIDIRQQWPQFSISFSDIGQAFQIHPPEHMEDEDKPLSPLGYKKMCAFKTFGFLNAPYISSDDLDYMFYLDDDSCLTEPIHYDVFQTMQHHKIAYAYKQLFLDRDYIVKGLTEFIEDHKQAHKLQYVNPSLAAWLAQNGFQKQGGGSHWTFATNLEWVDLRQYRRSDIMEFNKAVETSGMIFHRRWGDAPLRFILAYLFWDSTQVMRICSSYVHSMWNPSPSTCSDERQTPIIHDAVLTQLQNCTSKATCN